LRDNEDGAKAFTIPATLVKLQGFALAGFLAGMGGALFGHSLSRLTPAAFPVSASVNVVAMSVLGGLGLLLGPLIGAFYIVGLPRFLPLDSAGLAATSFGWLILILYFPGGIAQIMGPPRDRLVDWLARRAGKDPEQLRSGVAEEGAVGKPLEDTSAARRYAEKRRVSDVVLLEVHEIKKKYGGLVAVDGVSLSVRENETLGLIGPNGAGKTTLFELLGGFNKRDSGRIVFEGHDITGLRPEQRAQLGLIRSFQDAALFPTLTVIETVELALERSAPTHFWSSVFGFSGTERAREARARQLIGMMGLDRFGKRQIAELSTGTRRIAELTCLIALEPTVVLLDEPSSGIAQRETEELGRLLGRLRGLLNMTVVLIEHDMPLIMGLSDRIIAMESGSVLAEGSPTEIRQNRLVIDSYLGGDIRSIERSNGFAGADALRNMEAGGVRCLGTTRSGTQCTRRAVRDGYCAQHAPMNTSV
jgi:ABC-type branched-subunit amino acid transport system ATPase component